MPKAGHLLIDRSGIMVSVDRGFSALMKTEPEQLLGRLVLDLTAPADREECGLAIATLIATRTPFQITKRFIRDDGSLLWVRNSVSIVEANDGQSVIVATIDPVLDADDDRKPARLLDRARLLVAHRKGRAIVLRPELSTDIAWEILLEAYLAEAEARSMCCVALATELDISAARAKRWIDILLGQDHLEVETRGADPLAAKAFRLTTRTHRRLESFLSSVDVGQDKTGSWSDSEDAIEWLR